MLCLGVFHERCWEASPQWDRSTQESQACTDHSTVPGPTRETWAVTGGEAWDKKELHLPAPCVTSLSAKLARKRYFFCSYCWPCQTFATKSFVEAWNSTDCKADEMLGHARFTHQQLPFMSECVFCTPSLLRCQGQGGCKKHNASQGSEKHVLKTSPVPAHI